MVMAKSQIAGHLCVVWQHWIPYQQDKHKNQFANKLRGPYKEPRVVTENVSKIVSKQGVDRLANCSF